MGLADLYAAASNAETGLSLVGIGGVIIIIARVVLQMDHHYDRRRDEAYERAMARLAELEQEVASLQDQLARCRAKLYRLEAPE